MIDEEPYFAALGRMFAPRGIGSGAATDAWPAPLSATGRIGPAGLALIKQFETCARRRTDGLYAAYPDPGTGGDPWTIGWGSTGPGIARGTVWTQAQCDARLEADLLRFAREVERALAGAPTSEAQFDALVSFHYNTGAIARATLTRLHCRGDYAAAAAEFARWNRAGGRVLAGLTRRRAPRRSFIAMEAPERRQSLRFASCNRNPALRHMAG